MDNITLSFLQIYQEGSTFRGTLKTKAREIARDKYPLWPPSDWEGGQNQLEYYEYVQNAAEKLIDTNDFLHHGEDENV